MAEEKHATEETKSSEIVLAMVGTAGHVDHGKTSLVKALTGCDTDRLPEEKKRGMSIDLGFAPCRLPGNRIVGIVDVPGHVDFIRNMIAGAASIDVLMLVIAADDGIMPQTVEHLQIVSLLGTPGVLAVLTKVDLVDPTIRDTVILETREFLAAMGYPDAPVVPYSAVTGEGFYDVRRRLNDLVSQVTRKSDIRTFRMDIERVFSVKGYGTVVTGIPVSGCARVGDSIEIHPARKTYILRAIEAYKRQVDNAPAHSCAAINLRDLEPDQAGRGMTIAAPGAYRSVSSVVAYFRNVSDTIKANRITEGWLLAGTSKTRVIVHLLFAGSLAPRGEAFVLMKLDDPLVLAAGDRYVIRSLNPPATLGGGQILSTGSHGRRKIANEYHEIIERAHLALLDDNVLLAEILAGPYLALARSSLVALSHLDEGESERVIMGLVEAGELLDLKGGAYLIKAKIPQVITHLTKAIRLYHKGHPNSWGLDHSALCKMLGLEAKNYPKLGELLAETGKIVLSHNRYALPDFAPVLKPVDLTTKESILKFIYKGGLHGQVRGDVMKRFGLSEDKYRLFIRLLVEEESVKVTGNYVVHTIFFDRIREILMGLFAEKTVVTLTDLREALKAGRHFAVDILETFDAEGVTRRREEGRVLTPRSRRKARDPL
jgi:selenocysteine-specific elongation factor